MNTIIYTKNLQAMKNRFETLADIIESKQYQLKEDIIVECSNAKDGEKIISVEINGRKLYLNGLYAPKKEIEERIEKIGEINYMAPIFIVGIENALFIKELLKKTEKTVNIAVYEPSLEIFLKVLEEIDITELFENRPIGFIIEGINENETDKIINNYIAFENKQFFKQYISFNYKELFPTQVVAFLKKVDETIHRIIVTENTKMIFQDVIADNILNNICYLLDNYQARQLANVLSRDIPAILVSAGPSLNKNIKELRNAKNKAFIVAVDTALKPLLKEGIEPDLLVIVDGKKPLDLFNVEEFKNIPLLMATTSSKEVANFHKGKKFFFREGLYLVDKLFEHVGIPFYYIDTGGSVATNAMSFLYKMGYSNIILVGQDLALTNNKTHADGTFREKMETIDTDKYKKVDGYYGDKVPTRGDLKMYLDWFNNSLKEFKGLHVINSTEGGAKIENTEMIPLKDSIEKYCIKEVNIREEMDKLAPVFEGDNRIKALEYLHDIEDKLNEEKKDAKKIKKLYSQLEKLIDENSREKKDYEKILKKINKLREKIESNMTWFLISGSIEKVNYVFKSEAYNNKLTFEEEIKDISEKGVTMANLISRCVDVLMPTVKETVSKVE